MKLNFVFIAIIVLLSMVHNLPSLLSLRIKKRNINNVFMLLLFFFIFGFLSLTLNEPLFHTYFYYLFASAILFVGIVGIYKNNNIIETTLKTFFLVGLILSVYSYYFVSANDPHEIYQIGETEYATIGVFGSFVRQSIPGLDSNTFGSMLHFLILVGIFYIKRTDRKLKFFYVIATFFLLYTLFKTGSRGAFISLFVGCLYLIYRKWFNRKEIFLGLLVVSGLFLSAPVLIIRFLTSIAPYLIWAQDLITFLPFDEIPTEITLAMEPRTWTLESTSSLFLSSPIFGVGFSNFIDIQIANIESKAQMSIEHNHVFAMFAQGGLITALPYILIVLSLGILINKIIAKSTNMDRKTRDFAILLCAGTVSTFIDMNFAARTYTYYWIWLGFTASWIRNYENYISRATIGKRLWKAK